MNMKNDNVIGLAANVLSSASRIRTFAAVILASAAVRASQMRCVLLSDFEANNGSVNLGGEFPGAKGNFTITAAAAHDDKYGGRLSFDVTKGAYVAWGMNPLKPLAAGADTIALWVRANVPGLRIHCRTTDATGQEHIRYSTPLPDGTWSRITFAVEKTDGHWGGANDGRIHWPLSYVQIGVAPGAARVGYVDLDTLTLATTASLRDQPECLTIIEPRFGNLFQPDETPTFRMTMHMRDSAEHRYSGMWRVFDWLDKEAARGEADADQAISLPHLPSGCFRLAVDLQDSKDAGVHTTADAWFGVLTGPNPKPCGWVGTVTHGGHGWDRGDLRFLDVLNAAGIGVVRDEFGWSSIEKTKGKYATSQAMEDFIDGLNRHGIRLNLLLTYGNPIYANPLDPDAYARWAAWMAKHYEGRVRDFEIWNEPQNFMFGQAYPGQRDGKPVFVQPFVALTKKAGAAIRAVRPDANVILCSEDVWSLLFPMLTSGIGSAGNTISIHPYCHGQPRPEREWFFSDYGRELRNASLTNGGPSRVVITEAGWTTYEGNMKFLAIAGGYPRSSPAQQAHYLVRMFLTARAANADYATQYDFRDDGPNRSYTEHNFGLVHQDCSPKPSLLAVAAMTRLVGQGQFVRDAAPDPTVARAYVFDVNGKAVVCAYAIEKAMQLTLPVGVERLEQADLMGNRNPLAAPGGRVTLDLTERPIYLIGAEVSALK